MAEDLLISTGSKAEKYQILIPQIKSLIEGENDLVANLGWPQPQVSKHLSVLRQVGLVHVRRDGRQQMYTINAASLKPIHDWVKNFEKFWDDHLDRIKTAAEEKAKKLAAGRQKPTSSKPFTPE